MRDSNGIIPKSAGFKLEVYFNPCLGVALITLRLRFVASKFG
jgi:hypothetical protein